MSTRFVKMPMGEYKCVHRMLSSEEMSKERLERVYEKYTNDIEREDINKILDSVLEYVDQRKGPNPYKTKAFQIIHGIQSGAEKYAKRMLETQLIATTQSYMKYALVLRQYIKRLVEIFDENWDKQKQIQDDLIHYDEDTVKLFKDTIETNIFNIEYFKEAEIDFLNHMYYIYK